MVGVSMKKISLLCCLALFGAQAHAVTNAPLLAKGTSEVGVQGNLDFDYADDYLFNFNGSYGFFVEDNWEIGGKLNMSLSDNVEQYQLGAFTEYNFSTDSQWVPYVGVSAQYAYGEAWNNDASGFNVQMAGGIKYFIHPQVALSAEVNYSKATDDIYANSEGKAQDDKTQILFGTRFYF